MIDGNSNIIKLSKSGLPDVGNYRDLSRNIIKLRTTLTIKKKLE